MSPHSLLVDAETSQLDLVSDETAGSSAPKKAPGPAKKSNGDDERDREDEDEDEDEMDHEDDDDDETTPPPPSASSPVVKEEDDDLRQVSTAEAEAYAKESKLLFFEASAKASLISFGLSTICQTSADHS